MIETIQNFFTDNTQLLGWLAGISIITFLISILVIPVVISRLPARYFCADHRRSQNSDNSPGAKILVIIKNVVGAVLVLAGLLMFFIPGQGILTMLIGLGLMNFPGKYTLERKLISQPAVLNSINWIREKANIEKMVHPDDDV